jgi:hypothetical protein
MVVVGDSDRSWLAVYLGGSEGELPDSLHRGFIESMARRLENGDLADLARLGDIEL